MTRRPLTGGEAVASPGVLGSPSDPEPMTLPAEELWHLDFTLLCRKVLFFLNKVDLETKTEDLLYLSIIKMWKLKGTSEIIGSKCPIWGR